MQTMNVQIKAEVEFEVEIEISDKAYEQYENGELDGYDLAEMYDKKISKATSEFDLNMGDISIAETCVGY